MTARKQLAATLPAPCVECGRPVTPEDQWDIGHIVPLSQGGDPKMDGVSHRTCNRKAGGAIGARHNKRKTKQIREW